MYVEHFIDADSKYFVKGDIYTVGDTGVEGNNSFYVTEFFDYDDGMLFIYDNQVKLVKKVKATALAQKMYKGSIYYEEEGYLIII